jgi:hypothetical protein
MVPAIAGAFFAGRFGPAILAQPLLFERFGCKLIYESKISHCHF